MSTEVLQEEFEVTMLFHPPQYSVSDLRQVLESIYASELSSKVVFLIYFAAQLTCEDRNIR